MKKYWQGTIGAIALTLVSSSIAANAAQVVFQSDGTNPDVFTDLMVTGEVYFNTPLANVFGRDTSLAPLANNERFMNDFQDTLADEKFLNSTQEFHELVGVVFGLGKFNNPNYPIISNNFAGIKWVINIPEQIELTNRRIHIQFGEGLNAGGPAAIGGGQGKGRQPVIQVPTNIPGKKVWGQWINNQRFTDINEARMAVRAQAARRNRLAGDDPRLDAYEALLDNTQWVDPIEIESFYIDLENDDGNPFELELDITFANNLFIANAQFLDFITVEIGERNEFPEVYNDAVNHAFLGTTPFNLNLNMPGGGNGGRQSIQIGSADLVDVPEPVTILGTATTLGIGALLKRESSKKQKKS